ncbi:MAG: hypothetical protein NZ958_03565 [Bacteroidia bacterium]|nr:hypothetical protein [Bacteroidia bacterium]MDW8088297.1 hypothetical protein [Bacteroidia bacterium]
MYFAPRYLWLAKPPLERLQEGRGELTLFLSSSDWRPETQELLGKILGAVQRPLGEVEIWLAHRALTLERLRLFPNPLLWIFGPITALKKGVYEAESYLPIAPPKGLSSQRLVFVLPALTEMLNNLPAKREAWHYLSGLALRS